MRTLPFLTCLAVLALTSPAAAYIWRVPSEHPTICGAVDSAAYGDTVLVAPGTYCQERDEYVEGVGNFWIKMKSGVVLISEGGAEVTTLHYDSEAMGGDAVYCGSVHDAVIRGFTISHAECPVRNLSGYLDEAVTISSSSVLVDSCTVGAWFGSGVSVGGVGAGPVNVRNCHISNCDDGIVCYGVTSNGDLIIENNTITNCHWGIWCYDAAPSIIGNSITNCYFVGIYFVGCSPALLRRNVVADNGCVGLEIVTDVFCEPYFASNHLPTDGNQIYGNGQYEVYSAVDDVRSVVELPLTYWGSGCPDADRIYAYRGTINYIPWTGPGCTGLYFECPGATEPETWGGIKAMFR